MQKSYLLQQKVSYWTLPQRSLKCETLKNGGFVAEITPSRSMIEFHFFACAPNLMKWSMKTICWYEAVWK